MNNNSTFGITMENVRKKINVRLVNNSGDYINIQANQGLFHRKYLVKSLLLIMKLNQF